MASLQEACWGSFYFESISSQALPRSSSTSLLPCPMKEARTPPEVGPEETTLKPPWMAKSGGHQSVLALHAHVTARSLPSSLSVAENLFQHLNRPYPKCRPGRLNSGAVAKCTGSREAGQGFKAQLLTFTYQRPVSLAGITEKLTAEYKGVHSSTVAGDLSSTARAERRTAHGASRKPLKRSYQEQMVAHLRNKRGQGLYPIWVFI